MSQDPLDTAATGTMGFPLTDPAALDTLDANYQDGVGSRRASNVALPVSASRDRPRWYETFRYGTVDSRQLEMFCRQLAVYLEAGVNLLPALEGIRPQFSNTRLYPVIGRLIQAVRRGDQLDDAIAREPAIFDHLFRSMMRVAEARGGIPETLRMLSESYAARKRLIRQVRSALIYPAMVLLLSTLVITLLVLVVLPKLVGILEDFVKTREVTAIPLPTRMLISLAEFARTVGWWAVPLALVLLVVSSFLIYRTSRGKAVVDEIALRIPVLGPLLRKIDTTRFAQTLSTLLGSGIDIGSSLTLTADVMLLVPLARAVRKAREGVMEGVPLSAVLASSRRFYPDVVAIVHSGEETGRLPEMLVPLGQDYEDQVDYTVKNLGSLIQPLIVLVLGGFIMFIAIAFFMAYTSILTEISSPRR